MPQTRDTSQPWQLIRIAQGSLKKNADRLNYNLEFGLELGWAALQVKLKLHNLKSSSGEFKVQSRLRITAQSQNPDSFPYKLRDLRQIPSPNYASIFSPVKWNNEDDNLIAALLSCWKD